MKLTYGKKTIEIAGLARYEGEGTAEMTPITKPRRTLDNGSNASAMFVLDQHALAYKKVYRGYPDSYDEQDVVVATLIIPAGAVVHLPEYDHGKCRATEAVVLRLKLVEKNSEFGGRDRPYVSGRDSRYEYRRGKYCLPTQPFDPDLRECASGIHFFRTFCNAERY